jgi:hypothetical protein
MNKNLQRTVTAALVTITALDLIRKEDNPHTHLESIRPFNNGKMGLSVYNISAPIYTENSNPPYIQILPF